MEMSPETIRALLDAFERSDWREMVVEVGEDRLHVSRDQLTQLAPQAGAQGQQVPAAAPAGPVAAGDPPPLPVAKASSGGVPPTAPPAGPADADASGGGAAADDTFAKGTRVESPSVGLFW